MSMTYTWDKANANAPGRRKTQYFEMFGSRAIYHDGWMASAPPVLPSWEPGRGRLPTDVMNDFKWQLYTLKEDWTQDNDLAAEMPDRLRDLQQVFTVEAMKYQVFPLDDTNATRFVSKKPNYALDRSAFTYSREVLNIPGTGGAPNLLDKSYTITAEVEIPEGGAEGMLVTDGGRFAGYGFYLLKGPVFTWNLVDLERVKWESKEALAPGKHTLEFDWRYDGPGVGKGGTGTLKVDGKVIDSHRMERSLPFVLPCQTFGVGIDTGTPVDGKDYQVPFRFTGKLAKLTIKLGPEQLAPEEKKDRERD
jgi:hypothetical protein